ncbi:MAG TPA: GNAT family N-acetyltransferase [Edaphobacter sp.]|nr:GNAT family N-acetyltransferase [Edaphobacter sp.]
MPAYETVERNLREAMQCYACCSPLGEVREVGGVVIASSGVDYSVFNSAMFTSPVESVADLQTRITQAEVHFKARGLGWSCWMCEDLLAPPVQKAVRQFFVSRRMKVAAQPPGMYADRIWPRARQPANIEVRRVEDNRTRFDFADVASVVFALPFAISEKIYVPESTWRSKMTGWVGYVSERAVSIVATVVSGGAVGIYSLATVSHYQRHGYAETLMRHALESAHQETGIEKSVLQTTKAGIGLYKRMGYRPVTNFSVYLQDSCSFRE